MALDTYSGLQAEILDLINRADAAAAAKVVSWIQLAEGQMHRRFVGRVRQGMPYPRRIHQRSDASIAQGDEYVAAPTDFAGPLTFVLDGSPETVLDYLEPDNLNDWKAGNTLSGQAPRYYTVVNGEFQFYPVADQAYTAELTYLLRFPKLSDTNTSNWILADYPDAYLYGAALHSAPWLKDDSRLTTWGTLFTTAIDDICNADPTPSDKSTLRTEIPAIQWLETNGRYDVQTDNF